MVLASVMKATRCIRLLHLGHASTSRSNTRRIKIAHRCRCSHRAGDEGSPAPVEASDGLCWTAGINRARIFERGAKTPK